MKNFIVILLITSVYIQTTYSQNFFSKVSNHIWEGTGELLGSKAFFNMEWSQILDGKFYALNFQNQRQQSKEYVFKAMGIYKIEKDDTISGTWFDSRGITFPLKGTVSEDTLIIFWGTPETEQGKTFYSILDNNTIKVEDYILKEGKLHKFGSATYNLKD